MWPTQAASLRVNFFVFSVFFVLWIDTMKHYENPKGLCMEKTIDITIVDFFPKIQEICLYENMFVHDFVNRQSLRYKLQQQYIHAVLWVRAHTETCNSICSLEWCACIGERDVTNRMCRHCVVFSHIPFFLCLQFYCVRVICYFTDIVDVFLFFYSIVEFILSSFCSPSSQFWNWIISTYIHINRQRFFLSSRSFCLVLPDVLKKKTLHRRSEFFGKLEKVLKSMLKVAQHVAWKLSTEVTSCRIGMHSYLTYIQSFLTNVHMFVIIMIVQWVIWYEVSSIDRKVLWEGERDFLDAFQKLSLSFIENLRHRLKFIDNIGQNELCIFSGKKMTGHFSMRVFQWMIRFYVMKCDDKWGSVFIHQYNIQ